MLDAALAVQRWIEGKERNDFVNDEVLPSAVTYQIQIIGEAAAHISTEFRASHPEIPWQGIVGMRQIMVHAYRRVSVAVLWEVATERLPELIRELLKHISLPEDEA
jgi:uncharacterized protein with HEPN domain